MLNSQTAENKKNYMEIPTDSDKNKYDLCLKICEKLNKDKGNLNEKDGYECSECGNKGYIFFPKPYGNAYTPTAVNCKCKKVRSVLIKLSKSGLGNVIGKYTFDSFITKENWQKNIKEKALAFISENDKWFFIGGQSGCGKSHICTAICGKFLKMEKSVFYMLWIKDIKDLKNTINDYEKHKELLEKYYNTDVLYIDDFFKNGKEKDRSIQPPTPADIQLAYDILNSRYNNPNLITIISSERNINEIINIDDATGGRIYERANGGEFIINIKTDKNRNFRMKNFIEI